MASQGDTASGGSQRRTEEQKPLEVAARADQEEPNGGVETL